MIKSIDDSFNKQQYKKYLQHYLDSNIDEHVGGGNSQTRVSMLKKYLPVGSHVFEIGSGGGTDALALQDAGFQVTVSDYSEDFLNVLQSKNLHAVLFDAKKDMLPNGIGAIYANAVFVHFLPNELRKFLHNAKEKLTESKIIYFNVIEGRGNERKTSESGFDRDFQYYAQEELEKILSEEGYEILEVKHIDKWIQVIATSM
jgi:SAM-dependent methyltransferase